MSKERINNPQTVLVTGAAGGLGVHLVRILHQAGWIVRAYDLQSPEQARRDSLVEPSPGVEWFTGPWEEARMRELLTGCQAVVHAAGLVSLTGGAEEFLNANVEVTRQLFELSCQAGVDHFVYISCAFVYQTEVRIRTEGSPTRAQNAFEDSKLAAEFFLNRMARSRKDAPAVTILRLGMLYGPGCSTMGASTVILPALLREFSRYLPGITGGPRTNWCHVCDAADAVELVLRHPEARGALFNVTDETPLTFGEVLTSIAEAYGIDLGPSVPIPNAAIWALLSPLVDNEWAFDQARALLGLGWKRIQKVHGLKSPLKPRLNRDALYYLGDEAIVVANAITELGWTPRWPDFREGIKPTLRWYQEEGWAPRFDTEAEVQRLDATPGHHFRYAESLSGEISGPEISAPLQLELNLAWPSFPLPPSRREGHLEGVLSAPGLAREATLHGTIEIRWVPTLQIDYQFGFLNQDGQACRFQGVRKLDLANPSHSWGLLKGTIIDRHGGTVGTASLHLKRNS